MAQPTRLGCGASIETAPKVEPDIQLFCAILVALGFVVLVYDPIGQGERLGN